MVMGKKILLLLMLFITTNISAQDSLKFKSIDSLITKKEISAAFIPAIRDNVDVFKPTDSYSETFYADSVTKDLGKVEYSRTNPYVHIIYYFDKNKLIKVVAIDKSTSSTLRIISYFQDSKMVYKNPRVADGNNGEAFLLSKSKEYLIRYNDYMKN